MNKNVIVIGHGVPSEETVKGNGIEFVWEITVSNYAMKGNNDAESRLQRNVVNFDKKQC
jgi:hypothetical protein